MSLASTIAHKLWAVVLSLLGLFRRLVCRSGRGRKNSGTILPMVQEHIAVNLQQSVPTNVPSADYELQSWDSWGADDQGGFSMTPAGQHAQLSNVVQRNPTQPETEEDEPNFFEDMTPKIKKAPKVIIKKRDDNFGANGLSSRLTFAGDTPVQEGSELGTWEDTENAWGDEVTEDLSWEADAAIRDKRRLERERKIAEHQRKKMEKETLASFRNAKHNAPFSAVKLS